MKCEEHILQYNSIIQEDRVYIFLDELNDRLDKIRGDVLQIRPFPTVEQAYAHIRREDIRQAVMMTKGDTTPGAVMLLKGGQKLQQHSSLQMVSGEKKNMTKVKSQVEGGGCTHCGNMKHTRETCFKLHGYPEWWHELKEKKKRDTSTSEKPDRAALVSTESQLSLIPREDPTTFTNEPTASSDSGNNGHVLFCSNQEDHHGWVVDSGATDHMTFDP